MKTFDRILVVAMVVCLCFVTYHLGAYTATNSANDYYQDVIVQLNDEANEKIQKSFKDGEKHILSELERVGYTVETTATGWTVSKDGKLGQAVTWTGVQYNNSILWTVSVTESVVKTTKVLYKDTRDMYSDVVFFVSNVYEGASTWF